MYISYLTIRLTYPMWKKKKVKNVDNISHHLSYLMFSIIYLTTYHVTCLVEYKIR